VRTALTLLGLGSLLLPLTRLAAADATPSNDPTIVGLVIVASDTNAALESRLNAIDMIGDLGKKSAVAVSALQRFLNAPSTKPNEKSLYILHVVQALGKLGSAAIGVLPDLSRTKSVDLNLVDDIKKAETAICQAPAADGTMPDPLAPLSDFLSKGYTGLQTAVKNAKTPDDVITLVAPIVSSDKNDSLLRRFVAEIALPAANSTTPPKNLQDYISAVTSLLKSKSSFDRVFAAWVLGQMKLTCIPVELENATDDTDPVVKAAAQSAIAAIKKANPAATSAAGGTTAPQAHEPKT
jgi:hypothetical protein